MENFKYKERKPVTDGDILKFKDFKTVLNKRDAIAKSYTKITKIWGAIGLASAIAFISFFALQNTEEPVVETTAIVNSIPPTKQTEKRTTIIETSKETSTKPVSVKKMLVKQETKSPKNIVTKTDTVSVTTTELSDAFATIEKKSDNQFGFHFKTEEERVHLPSVFVGGQRWPKSISKNQLVIQSNLAVKYKAVQQEVPIVNYVVLHFKNGDLESKPTRITVTEGKFSAKLLQQMHRAQVGDVLVYKNITVYIPGVGVTNLGDMKVLIDSEKAYNRRINSRLD